MMPMFASFKKKSRIGAKKKVLWRPSLLQVQMFVGLSIVVVIALVVTAVWFGTRIDSLQIHTVEVIGGETISHTVIEDKVHEALLGSYFKLIPKRFMPLYPQHEVERQVGSLDRIKNVHVEITDDQTLTVVFDEYLPFALWCENLSSAECYFIDRTGYSFALAPELEGSAFVRYIDEGVVPQKNTQGFENSFIKETEAFATRMKDTLSLYATHIYKKGSYDVEYTISGGGVIKVSQIVPAEESYENLQTILLSDAFKHIEPGAFAYIDLRFGDKVFVNEELADPEIETASSSATTPGG